MMLHFYKYHGAGNDFIMIDDRKGSFSLAEQDINSLCDRHFGIGADGLILLQTAGGYDFGMIYYNSDGRESTMCGNGGRCITAFARQLGVLTGNEAHFIAIDGPHESRILSENPGSLIVRLKMKNVEKIEKRDEYFFLNTGSPHYVEAVNNVDIIDIRTAGSRIRYDAAFAPGGTNVNFVEYKDNTIRVRTYERGVEDETLSCGTGVTAVALASAYSRPEEFHSPVTVEAVGGTLKVHFIKNGDGFQDIWLEGPASFVFEGNIEIA